MSAFARQARPLLGGPERRAADLAVALGPWNLAGLCAPSKRGRYAVELADLVDRADVVGLDADEMRALLPRFSRRPTDPWPP